MTDLVNFLIGTLWGGATVGSWAVVFVRALRAWRERRDQRSVRELRTTAILLACALSFGLALLVHIVVPESQPARDALFGLFSGMFTVAGLTLALFKEEVAP